MIFRRLAHAIREQNWFIVVLEVAIVVVGILIGLEVDDWNQRRLDRDNDRRVLDLFINELKDMQVSAASDLDVTSKHLKDLSEASRIALSCDATSDEQVRLKTESFNLSRACRVFPASNADIWYSAGILITP